MPQNMLHAGPQRERRQQAVAPTRHSHSLSDGSREQATPLRIGLDFDNTLVQYDSLFLDAAREMGLLPPGLHGGKREVRDAVRTLAGGELLWQRLQAEVYAGRMHQARLFPGVREFLGACTRQGIPLLIVSHKSRHATQDPDRRDLRALALQWLEQQGLFEPAYGLHPAQVHFTDSREQKLRLIGELGCSHFVDDLNEVIQAPAFPAGVCGLLFDPAAGTGSHAVRHWDELHRLLTRDIHWEKDRAVAEELLGMPPRAMAQVHGGGNSRVYRVTDPAGRQFALKRYPDDGRQRMERETSALALMRLAGISTVPELVAQAPAGYALMGWLEGEPPKPVTTEDVRQLTGLLSQLHELRTHPFAEDLSPASDACPAPVDFIAQLQRRRGRFEQVKDQPELQDFLSADFDPLAREWTEHFLQATEAAGVVAEQSLPLERQTLNPADIGFHNALRDAHAELCFLDFEFFGWDDPVKPIADLLLHPRGGIPVEQRTEFMHAVFDIYGEDADLRPRLERSLPMAGLIWCLILLNEFLPDGRQRRRQSGRVGDEALTRAHRRQLARARALLQRLPRLCEELCT